MTYDAEDISPADAEEGTGPAAPGTESDIAPRSVEEYESALSTEPDSESTAPAVVEREDSGSFLRWLLETAVMVAIAFALAQGIKAYLVQPFIIPTGSMEPTIQIGDRVLAEKVSYRFGVPEAGDVVVFDDPNGTHPQLIKRVIAVAGQTVDIRDGRVYIDDTALDEPYLHDVVTDSGSERLPLTIPDGYVWLMGDNRPNSGDSRYLGPQPLSAIHGRAFAIYWPLRHAGGL